MRTAPEDEADALAALFAGKRSSAPPRHATVPAAPPVRSDTPDRDRRAVMIVAGAIVASLVALVILVRLLPPVLGMWSPFAQTIAIAAPIGLIAWGACRVIGMRLPGAGRQAILQAALWAAIGTGAVAWCVLSLSLGGRLRPDDAQPGVAVLIGIAAAVAQAAGEELFFRGWIQPALGRFIAPAGALLLAAAMFAAIHLIDGWMPPLALLNMLLAGLWFGLLARRTDGLAAPIAAHGAWNATEMSVFGLFPNPGSGPWGALSGHDIVGAYWWGGGPTGLNASVLTSLTLGGIVALLLAFPAGQRA